MTTSAAPPDGCIWLPAEPAFSRTGVYGYALEIRGDKVFAWFDLEKTWDCHEAGGVVVALLRRMVIADADLGELATWIELLSATPDKEAQAFAERLAKKTREALGVGHLPKLGARSR